MPEFRERVLSFAFDMCGCPNRCRHCWLGKASNSPLDAGEIVERFLKLREHVESGAEQPHLERVRCFASYFREPHYSDGYRDMRDRELELNGGIDFSAGYELLSVWRLARDPAYAPWARMIGVRKCQIALFGMADTNDWFCRRVGAHADILSATLRLLENGIQPRWQVFVTKKGLRELPDLLDLVDFLHLRERSTAMGGRFELFLNDATPIGEARRLEGLRVDGEDVASIPGELIRSTEDYTGKPFRWATEAEWISEVLSKPDRPVGLDYPKDLWFNVDSLWDVYPNVGSLEPWWRLGNLRRDSPASLFGRFLHDGAPALRGARDLSMHEAARRYGDPRGGRMFGSETDLQQLWLERWCESQVSPGQLS